MSHQPRRAKHFSGSAPDATTTPGGTKYDLNALGFRLLVSNLDDANTMELSLDNGRNWYPIAFGEEFKENVHVHFFRVRGAAGAAVSFSAIAFVG